MTEREWLKCNDPKLMLEFLCGKQAQTRKKNGRRRLRLFACACLRCIWALLRQEGSRQAVECAERFADELATEQELADALIKGRHALGREGLSVDWQSSNRLYWQSAEAANHVARKNFDGGDHPSMRHAAHSTATAWALNRFHSSSDAEIARQRIKGDFELQQAVHANLLRDIFNNPFRPVDLDLTCHTSKVVALAQKIYDYREFDQMPVLADALEEAGCTDPETLAHCRRPGPHCKGCWVVDAVLEKE
jgi:hypothetical protein